MDHAPSSRLSFVEISRASGPQGLVGMLVVMYFTLLKPLKALIVVSILFLPVIWLRNKGWEEQYL